jgi:adenylate cyclase
MSQHHQLVAILFTDIVGYTTLMQENEQNAVGLIKHYNSSLGRLVLIHGGKVLNYYGDGSLCTFPSATSALNCALELQQELKSDPQVPLRIGLHIGEIFFEEEKALGDGVNVASRIQSLGQANTILFSREIFDKIKNHPEFQVTSIGMFDFKNVEEPVEVFALANTGLIVPRREQMTGKLKRNLSKRRKTSRFFLFIIIIAALLTISALFVYPKFFNQQNDAVDKSIMVIPFVNMSNDPQQEYFAEGMMDEVLNHLYKIGGLNVISRTTSLAYKDTKKTTKEIANELGVGSLLEGSVQKNGDHIRIIAQLINGKTDKHLWAETYDRDFKDVFSIQSDIAQQIASALKIQIDPAVKERLESKRTDNIEAYNLYLRAENPTTSLEDTRLFYETAIRLDSTFSEAYSGLAGYWINRGLGSGDLTAQEVLENADPLLQKAFRLNSNSAEAYLVKAWEDLWFKWDFESVGKAYQKVKELNPSNPEILSRLNWYLLSVGNFKEAMDISSKSFEIDSISSNRVDLAMSMYFNNDPKNSLQLLERVISSDADWYLFHNYLRICVYTGEYRKAISFFEIRKSSSGFYNDNFILGHAAIAYYKTGLKDSAEKILNEIELRSKNSSVGSPSYYMATIYASMGENEKAIHWLQKGYKDHEVEMYFLNVEPLLISLRRDQKFKEILTKIGFK